MWNAIMPLKSLTIGAKDMLAIQVPFKPSDQMAMIDVPGPTSGSKDSRA
jgi:hypothetical protein